MRTRRETVVLRSFFAAEGVAGWIAGAERDGVAGGGCEGPRRAGYRRRPLE